MRNVYKYTKAYSGKDNIEFDEKDVFVAQVPLGYILGDKMKDVTKDVTKEILLSIKNNSKITAMELAKQLNITGITVLRHIENLKKENKISRIGGRKQGKWIILK
jgi:ATP-dependent DNA helicase RecG